MKTVSTSVLPGWRKVVIETIVCAVLILILALLLHSLVQFDDIVISRVNRLPGTLSPVMQAITWFGNITTLVGVAVVWSAVELTLRRRDRAIAMAASLLSLPLFYVIKETVRRSRPILSLVGQAGFHGYSFPSGHSTGSAAVYGVLAFLIARRLPSPWRRIVPILAAILVIGVGISRVYLHAHFPSDVVAGWLVGLAVYNIIASFQRKRPIEVASASDPTDEAGLPV